MAYTAPSVSAAQQNAIDNNPVVVDDNYSYLKNLATGDPMAAILVDVLKRLKDAEARLAELS